MLRQFWLVNYRSGSWEGASLAEAIKARVCVRELDFSRLDSQLEEAAGFDRVIVVGGDGTFASVLNEASLPSSPLHNTPIGLIPLGTANDLAREVGTYDLFGSSSYDDLPQLFQTLLDRRIAIWELAADGERFGFCNYASLGFEGAVVADFHQWRKKSKIQHRLMNRVMYTGFGVRHQLSLIRGAHIMEGDTRIAFPRTNGIILSNVKSHMGIGVLTGESDPFDDLLECVRASAPIDYVRMILAKTRLLPSLRALHRGSSFSIEGLPSGTPLQIDGEPKPAVRNGRVEVRLRGFARVLTRS